MGHTWGFWSAMVGGFMLGLCAGSFVWGYVGAMRDEKKR